MEHQTIEAFFLADYQRIKEENDALKAQINEYKMQEVAEMAEGGFTDLGKKVEAVYYEVLPSYRLFGSNATWGEFDAEKLRALLGLDDNTLFDKAAETKATYSDRVAKRRSKTFPFSVAFSSYKGRNEYAYDPDKDKTNLVEVEMLPDTNRWVLALHDKDSKTLAVEEIREMIRERIEELEKRGEHQ